MVADRFAEIAGSWRGDILESRHWGVAAVANARGEVIAGWGDIDLVTYPRSSMKPFQALALVETGAADAFHLTPQHLALACASHRGEAHHTELVGAWLDDIGCSEHDLACGPEYPKHLPTQHAMIARGEPATPRHHNCSGKHLGFLTVCRHCGHASRGYDRLDHPAQQAFAALLDDLGAKPAAWGIDGCTLPTPALSLAETALIGARFANGSGDARRRAAMQRLMEAMLAHPTYASGTDHPMAAVSKATGTRVTFKVGAEAFLLAFLPEDGLSIAIKVADGNSRARVPALLAILQGLDLLSTEAAKALAELIEPPVTNSRGKVVGWLRPARALGEPPYKTAAE